MRHARFSIMGFCFLSAVSLAGAVDADPAQKTDKAADKIKVMIVTGFDVGAHNWQESSARTAAILGESDRFAVKISETPEVFATPALKDYDVVVLNYGFWKQPDPSDEAKAGLLNFVKSGKGVVALHFACSSFQEWDEYHEMLGRWWKKGTGGHGPFGEFTVNIRAKDHPITKGLKDFQTEDELYARLSGEGKLEVLASAFSKWSDSVEPIVFVKRHGDGRVVQNLLGHGPEAQANRSYQELVRRCTEWAATGKVTAE